MPRLCRPLVPASSFALAALALACEVSVETPPSSATVLATTRSAPRRSAATTTWTSPHSR